MDWRARGKKLVPVLTVVFMALVAYLLYQSLSEIDWKEVGTALDTLSTSTLLLAAAFTFCAHFLYSTYDLLSLNYLRVKGLKFWKMLGSAEICHVINLNLGALVGGLGLRYKIYSGWKIERSKVSMLPFISAFTSWSGYVVLLGVMFCLRPTDVAEWVPFSSGVVLGIGLLIIGLVLAYLVMCLMQVKVKLRGRTFHLPRLSGALLQFGVSTGQWCLPSVVIYVLLSGLGGEINYWHVLFTHLLAGIIGVLTHIPGGLGVLETIFLRSDFPVPASQMLVALLCFRAIYYLFPLAIVVPGYIFLEFYQKKRFTESAQAFPRSHHSPESDGPRRRLRRQSS